MVISNLRVPTTKQIRALESAWIKSVEETAATNWGQVLMEVAGRAASHCTLSIWNENPGHVAIFAGTGNNGGDGMVVARYLNLWGIPASVFIVGEGEMTTAEARTNKKLLERLDIEIVQLSGQEDLEDALESIASGATVIVDAIFGTGLSRDVGGIHRTVIDAINNSARPVLSIDIPSGINSDNGRIMGAAVRADQTVTFGYLKAGLLTFPGAEYAGQLSLVDIGLPDFSETFVQQLNLDKDSADNGSQIWLTTCGAVQGIMPFRPTNSHKGTFGQLLTIAGSLGMSGAGVMAAASALKIGAGLSYLSTARSLIVGLPTHEIVYKPLSETTAQSISQEAVAEVLPLIDGVQAVVLGPGLSQNHDTVSFVLSLIDIISKPCVIDADGLNALAQNPEVLLGQAPRRFVLTPHPRELSRLTGQSVEVIQSDRIGAALAAARKFGSVVVLKGHYSVIASPTGQVFINPTGNSGMATAGAGDVLSGMIGGLMAQGLPPFDAAVAGVYLHGKAGDLAANRPELAGAQASLVATDILAHIPFALASLQAGDVSYLEERLLQSVSSL
ncbi:MAG TPA: NAD(P)H-hydrate dehydratase [Candidatus Obscuribacter sp.]|nr:NAD(P)H-hydrate dehydratase [Candidatus Obscuribacter sp.]